MADQVYDEVVDPKPDGETVDATRSDDEGYARGLGSRQIQMIAIGGVKPPSRPI